MVQRDLDRCEQCVARGSPWRLLTRLVASIPKVYILFVRRNNLLSYHFSHLTGIAKQVIASNEQVYCAVCAPLCAGCCARRLCAVRFSFLVVLTFFFPTATDGQVILLGEINETRTSTSSILCTAAYVWYVRSLPTKKRRARHRLLYSTGLLPSSHAAVDASASHAALRGLSLCLVFNDRTTTTTTTTTTTMLNAPSPCVSLAAEPR